MKIEVVTEASLSINFPFFSDCRLAGRTVDRCRAIHLTINDRRVQAKVNAPDCCHWRTRYVSLIVYQDNPLDLTDSPNFVFYSPRRALGCLFTSFASQFHQLFFSYGTVVGVGVGMSRDCSTLMVAQYFKRKREFVEIFIVSGSGLGIVVMSTFIKSAIEAIGWRFATQQ